MLDIIDAVIKKKVDDTISIELKENKKEKATPNRNPPVKNKVHINEK